MQHECYTNDTSEKRVLHELLILIKARVKTYNSHPYINYIANESILPFGNTSFPSQNVFENCIAKTELCNYTKPLSKSYILDCSCSCPCRSNIITHSNAASFSIKIALCETNSILFSKN